MITTVIKQPGETLRRSPMFDTAAPIAALLDAIVTPRGLVPGAAALTAEGVVANGVLTLSIAGGGDGERYLVTTRIADTTGAVLEDELEIAVIEASWQLPDGGAPYLSIAEFVARFGLDEVVRMTDADGSGRIDRDLLIGALTDAQAIADAHLAGRYALPLTVVPALVALAIADLARNRLYPRGAPEGVADAAKTATRFLERIQAGTMQLAIPGAAAVEAPSATPILISPGHRRYPDGLCDY